MTIIFTPHAEYRLEKRKILKEEVIDAIKFPNKIIKKHGLYYFQKNLKRGYIEVCCEKTESVIKGHYYLLDIKWK